MSVDFRLPISPESPCGGDSTNDPEVLALAMFFKGTEANGLREAQEPDWAAMEKQCTAFLAKSRHVDVLLIYAVTLLKRRGLEGVAEGLEVVAANVKNFWTSLSPRREDPGDIFEKVNALECLTAPENVEEDHKYIRRLKEVVLYQFPLLGKVTLGGLQKAREEGVEDFETAVKAEQPDALLKPLALARRAEEAVRDIVDFLGSLTAPKVHVSFDHLSQALSGIVRFFESGHGSVAEAPAPVMEGLVQVAVPAGVEAGAAGQSSAVTAGSAAVGTAGLTVIRNREDVLRALDAVCSYYQAHEPSSPLPILLKRCRDLVPKSFLDVVQELLPESVSQIKKLAGIPES
jgi:type VI secretion system protein ImpA